MTLDDIAGQVEAKEAIRALLKRGIGGRALLLEGPSGVGKTTVALVIARMLELVRPKETYQSLAAGSSFAVQFCGACDVDVATIKQTELWLGQLPWPPAEYKMAIIDEVQTVTENAKRAMLSIVEALPEHAIIILTTTEVQDELFHIEGPFASRCSDVILFERPKNSEIGERIQHIAVKEIGRELTIDELSAIIRKANSNVRTAIQRLDRYLGSLQVAKAA
jgi:DNA polymerase-3 subunit gamma/tau